MAWPRSCDRGGAFVPIVSPDLARFRTRGLIAHTVLVHPQGRQLDRVAELLGREDLLINIDRTFPLHQAADAHAYAERGQVPDRADDLFGGVARLLRPPGGAGQACPEVSSWAEEPTA
ncbi:zinc-binding dehydrogenase [Sphaerisporangium sp. NPDC004334]